MMTKRISGGLHPQTMPQSRLRIFQPAPQGSQLRAEVKHTVCGGRLQPARLMQNLLNGYSFDIIVMQFLLILVGIPAAHFATCLLALISPAISDPSSPPIVAATTTIRPTAIRCNSNNDTTSRTIKPRNSATSSDGVKIICFDLFLSSIFNNERDGSSSSAVQQWRITWCSGHWCTPASEAVWRVQRAFKLTEYPTGWRHAALHGRRGRSWGDCET
jgi:hypothetical protein